MRAMGESLARKAGPRPHRRQPRRASTNRLNPSAARSTEDGLPKGMKMSVPPTCWQSAPSLYIKASSMPDQGFGWRSRPIIAGVSNQPTPDRLNFVSEMGGRGPGKVCAEIGSPACGKELIAPGDAAVRCGGDVPIRPLTDTHVRVIVATGLPDGLRMGGRWRRIAQARRPLSDCVSAPVVMKRIVFRGSPGAHDCPAYGFPCARPALDESRPRSRGALADVDAELVRSGYPCWANAIGRAIVHPPGRSTPSIVSASHDRPPFCCSLSILASLSGFRDLAQAAREF